MKVAVTFDGVSALGKTPDLLILETVEAVEQALEVDGHNPVRVPVNPDGRWIERIRRGKFDLIFNLCEGIDGVSQAESQVISAMELLGIPFTGASSWTTALCLRKNVVNGVLDRAGLPVPRFALVRPGDPIPSVGFPAICKPAAEDASVGVEQRSVVRTQRELKERIEQMHEVWPDVLVQRFVDGREVNVGIVGKLVLPIAEIDFREMPKGMWRIVSFRSKWETGCDEDLGARATCPADVSARQQAELERVALTAWRLVGGDGYGRCDFRIDRSGRPWLLEVNANPDFSPDAGLARMARAAGMDYTAMVREIVRDATDAARSAPAERWAMFQRLSGLEPAAEPARPDRVAAGQR
jgi:D-alanine-D-alanine ligase